MNKKKSIVIVLSDWVSRRPKLYGNIFSKLREYHCDDGILPDLCLAVPYGETLPEELTQDWIFKFWYDNGRGISDTKEAIIEKYENEYKYVHILEDDVLIKDPSVISDFERMSDVLNYPILCGHSMESQNYNFGQLVPKFSILDLPIEGIPEIHWYGHPAKAYIMIATDRTEKTLRFDTKYNYFYLEEFFWRLRHFNKSVPFLGFYPGPAGEKDKICRDASIESHITREIVNDASNEVKGAKLKWEIETNLDNIIDFVANVVSGGGETK